MASMKLWKPSHGYGANQSKLSQYQNQEYNMSQSSQSHRSHLSSSTHASDQFDRVCANNSTRYHAQANSVLPSPSIHVQETNHVTETLKRQESHTEQQWFTKNDTCPNPARSSYSAGGSMYDDGHRIGEIERAETLKRQESQTDQQWSSKNDTCRNSARPSYSAGGSMYDDAHRIGKIERAETLKRQESQTDQQWSSKNDTCPNSARSSYSAGGTMYDDAHWIGKVERAESLKKQENQIDQQWATKNDQCRIPAHSSYSAGGAMYDDAHRIGNIEHGSANKATQFSSSIQANHHGQSMLHSQDDKSYKYNTNSFDGECLSPMKTKRHGQTMIKEQADQQSYNFGKNSFEGNWATQPNHYSGSNQFNYSTQNKYKQQDHHGLNDKANKYYSSAEMGHPNHALHQEGLMMGSKDHSWVSSPTQPNQSSLSMHKSNYLTEKMDHALVNCPTRANSSTFNMHKEGHMLGEIDGGFGMKSTNCSNAIQANQCGQSMYKGHGENAYSINDHGIHRSQSKNSGRPYQYGSSHGMYNEQDQYGQSIYQGREEDIFNLNDRDVQSDCIDSLGQKQYDYSSNNMYKGQQQYGSMMGHSGHSQYNKHHEYEDENVDDIMDEILSKYPAHNVSSGYGSCASRPKQFSYTSSTSSSSAKKFEMRDMMNNGGFYNNGFGNHYGSD